MRQNSIRRVVPELREEAGSHPYGSLGGATPEAPTEQVKSALRTSCLELKCSDGGRKMVCGACGHQPVDGGRYCQACGARVPKAPAGSQRQGFDQQPWMPLTSQHAFQGAPPPFGFAPPNWIPTPQIRRARVRQNLQPLGITWCLWGVFRLVMGTFAGFWLHAVAHHHAWFWNSGDSFPNFLTTFLPVIAISLVVMASPLPAHGMGFADGQTLGTNAGHHHGHSFPDQDPAWNCPRHLHALGARSTRVGV